MSTEIKKEIELEIAHVLLIVADNLSKAGWSWGCASAIDSNGRTIWIVDAHRDGQRFIEQDEKRRDTEAVSQGVCLQR
jgi:hypothetical protein